MIEDELSKIIKAAEVLSPYLKKNIHNECRAIAAKYNNLLNRKEQLIKEKYMISGDSMEKIINLAMLHGYNETNIDEIKDSFIRWMIENKNPQYRNDHITRDLLLRLSTEFYMFVLDNEREPVDYDEFKKHITNEDKH